jgi:NAD(P)H dehydrogenase (quinone)
VERTKLSRSARRPQSLSSSASVSSKRLSVFAVILTKGPQRHAGKTYDISGPAAVTMDEVAGYISAALGTRVEYHTPNEAGVLSAKRA